MIAMSIALAVWTAMLQIVERRTASKRLVSTEEAPSENVEKQSFSEPQKA